MKEKLSAFYAKDSTQKVVASLLSILIGLVVGSLVILIVGLTSKSISTNGAWEGIRLIFAGIFSTGRDASGALSWGFNPERRQYALPRDSAHHDRPFHRRCV